MEKKYWHEGLPALDDSRFSPQHAATHRHKRIDYDQLRRLAMLHPSHDEIAAFFGLTIQEFERRRALDPAIDQLIESGKAQGKLSLRRAQFINAIDAGDTTMQKHLGEHVLGQVSTKNINKKGESLSKDEAKQAIKDALEDMARDMRNNAVDNVTVIEHDQQQPSLTDQSSNASAASQSITSEQSEHDPIKK